MSYSVSNLFKAITANGPQPEGKMDNPDIPESNSQSQDRKFIRDQALNALKVGSYPRNGDGFLLPRQGRTENPKLEAFLLDGSIDPNNIRQRVNPISEAMPMTGEGAVFGVDTTMKESFDSLSLVQKARESYYNYNNRFNAISTPATPPTATPPNTPATPPSLSYAIRQPKLLPTSGPIGYASSAPVPVNRFNIRQTV